MLNHHLRRRMKMKTYLRKAARIVTGNIGCPKKSCLLMIFSITIYTETTWNGDFFVMKIRAKELYLSKFWRHLVNVKIVKIWHSNSHISYIIQKKKYIFCKNKHYNAVNNVPIFQLSAKSSSFFAALFPSLLWNNFFWDTQYDDRSC